MFRNKLKKILWLVVWVLLAFKNTKPIFAADEGTISKPIIPNPLATNTIAGFITLLLDTIFPIASLASIFLLIYAGFRMVIAGGNEEKLGSAKKAFLWTIIGIGVLLGAKVFSAVICGTISQLSTTQLSCPK